MKTVTPTELRTNIYKILDEILENDMPIDVIRKGKRLRIEPVQRKDKLSKLIRRPDCVVGDPADLVDLSWEGEVKLDLP
ncbi:hypothetical protein JCM14469_33100 [Desulfatiferula olefinivorans]|jgi:hypothetical protein